ncbi:MAG: carboxypeptidase M32 [archaeon]
MSATTDPGEAYEELTDRYARIANVEKAAGVLNWDQQTMMPEAGTPARSGQLSALSAVRHDLLTDPELSELLDAAEAGDLTDDESAVVREIRYEHERAARVPEELVEDISRAQSDAQKVWQDARANDDFEGYAPTLTQLRDLHVERAEHIDPDRDPFEVMYEDSERDLPMETVEGIFEQIREELIPLVAEIEERGDDLPRPFDDAAPYDPDEQRALHEDALDRLGFDRDRARLDTSPHPFTFGNQFDCRITTRFDESDPIDGLMSTIHEFGHATYQLGLSQEHYANPLGESRSSGVHESQSRFWENHVGRTKAFWEGFLLTFEEHFPGAENVTPDAAYQAVNRIYPDNLIRVEADELTYHMHIVLRHEIGRAFVNREIDVDELPIVWNDRMEEYLGVRPDTDADGVLQDIHWSMGFAAFESYTIGSVLAAQLDHAMREDLDDVDALIRDGEFGPIHEWMTENVHSHGKRYRTDELIEAATGEPLTADYFVEYATEKFTDLYGL